MNSLWPVGGSPVIAVARARYAILSVAATYLLSIGIGIILEHAGNRLALEQRDRIVGSAHQRDPSALADDRGHRLAAAFLDASRNLLLGAVPKTISGLAVVMPYPMVAYQGWVGGIVSVSGDHTSRLRPWRSALYYIATLILQIIPYSMAVGAGVHVGFTALRRHSHLV